MSRGNSALASLTANYTDSEDEDDGLSPAAVSPTSQSQSPEPEPIADDQGSSSNNSNSLQLPPSSSALAGGGDQGSSSSTLVSYHFSGIEGQIDDEAIDDFPHSNTNSNASSHSQPEEKDPLSLPGSPDLELMDTTGDIDPEADPSGEAADSETTRAASNPEDDPTSEDLTDPKRSKLPPEPQGKPDPKLQEKFTKMYQQKLAGKLNMNEMIQKRKMFRNPSIYEKLISHLNIDEFGTNYPESAYNPHEWPESSFYDELSKAQKLEMDRREKERKDRTKVEFVSGTLKKPTAGSGIPVINPAPAVGSTQGSSEDLTAAPPAKRKSKWDQKGVMPPLLGITGGGGGGSGSSHHSQQPQQPITIPPSIVSSVAAAAKAKTLINAFGHLPKRK